MNFAEIIKAGKDEGSEKHVPCIEIDKGHKSGKNIIRVVVGHDTPHPNTAEHHIEWIELYGLEKDNDQVISLGRATWAPVYSNPNVRFQIKQSTQLLNQIEPLIYSANPELLLYCKDGMPDWILKLL